MGIVIQIGRLTEPMARAREWYADAWGVVEKAEATDDQVKQIANSWHYLKSPYLLLERGNGQSGAFPSVTLEAFALISACLLIQRVEEMQAAERAGTLSDIDRAIGLFWLCRFAWNMSKITVITPAAKKAAEESAASTLGAKTRGVPRPNRQPNPSANPAFVSEIKREAPGKKEWGVAWRWLLKQEGKEIGIFDITSVSDMQVSYKANGKSRDIKQTRFRVLYSQNGGANNRKK